MNQGRWVAHCDTDGCSGAERVWPNGQIREKSGRKYGISRQGVLNCGNCGLTSSVTFPVDRKQITRLLNRRPVPETRNWFPGETVEALAEESVAHGLG
jgi:hypothetical protein